MSVRITGKHPNKIAEAIRQAITKIIPNRVKQIGLEHFDNSFAQGGWTGGAFIPWEKRKSKSKKNQGRALMIVSSRLRRSLRGKDSSNRVTFSTDVPYAQIHNEGGDIQHAAMSKLYVQNRIKKGARKGQYAKGTTKGRGTTGKAYTVHMQKRQFIGDSTVLRRKISNMIETELQQAFNN